MQTLTCSTTKLNDGQANLVLKMLPLHKYEC